MISDAAQYEDLQSLLFGAQLGAGIHRKVAVYKPDPSLVVKIAQECPNINVLEEEVWRMVEHCEPLARWLAPCVSISECGIFLLQKRVFHKTRDEYPKMVPSFFGDLKYRNFGWIDGRFVCCDYAGFISTSASHKWSSRMKKADWWE